MTNKQKNFRWDETTIREVEELSIAANQSENDFVAGLVHAAKNGPKTANSSSEAVSSNARYVIQGDTVYERQFGVLVEINIDRLKKEAHDLASIDNQRLIDAFYNRIPLADLSDPELAKLEKMYSIINKRDRYAKYRRPIEVKPVTEPADESTRPEPTRGEIRWDILQIPEHLLRTSGLTESEFRQQLVHSVQVDYAERGKEAFPHG